MGPKEFIQKVVRRLKYEFMLRGFFREPRPLLKLLFALRLDIPLFVLPYIAAHNRFGFRRLKQLRKEGYDPAVIFFSMEGDGRFERLYELSKSPTTRTPSGSSFQSRLQRQSPSFLKPIRSVVAAFTKTPA